MAIERRRIKLPDGTVSEAARISAAVANSETASLLELVRTVSAEPRPHTVMLEDALSIAIDASDYFSAILGIQRKTPVVFVREGLRSEHGADLWAYYLNGEQHIDATVMRHNDERLKKSVIAHETAHHFDIEYFERPPPKGKSPREEMNRVVMEGKAGFLGAAYATIGDPDRMHSTIDLLRKKYNANMSRTVFDVHNAVVEDMRQTAGGLAFLDYYRREYHDHGTRARYRVGSAIMILLAVGSVGQDEYAMERFSAELLAAPYVELTRRLYEIVRKDIQESGSDKSVA